MTRIVILGAGVSGLSLAMELKQLIREGEEITVVSDTATINFNPSNHRLAVDVYKPQEMSMDLGVVLSQHGIGFIQKSAAKVHTQERRVELEDGSAVDYDILVIATGPRPAFEAISGFGPDAYTHSICRVSDAGKTGEAWEEFVRDPGPVVIGAVQGASNITAAYEYAMIVDADMRRRGIRERVPLKFVTPEPYIGYRVQGGADDSRKLLENEFRAHDISWIVGAQVERIEANKLYIFEMGTDGQVKQKHEIPFKHCMLMPAFVGVDALQGVEGLVNAQGFVVVDERQRNPNFPDIYAVGVSVDIPASDTTPVPVAAAKTGYMIESMAHAAAGNIRTQLDGKEPTLKADWNTNPQNVAGGAVDSERPWINALGGLYAPHLWQQLSEVEKSK